jgi:enamine deaminase RidA (YjgF/YER057c/UK114 family)
MTAPKPQPAANPFGPADTLPQVLQPKGWPRPSGYANGISATGRLVVTGGMVGWDPAGKFPSSFAGQVRQTLANILEVLAEAGAGPQHLVRLTWYVTDLAEYRASLKELGRAYRETIGAHYPAMAVVEVKGLLEPQAKVEIEGTAMLPE